MIFIVGGAFQGKGAFAETHFKGKKIVVHYEETIREELLSGKDPLAEAEDFLRENRDAVIISAEVGYGLVPVDAFERKYREAVGRVNCYLAGEAEKFYRVVCGEGERLK